MDDIIDALVNDNNKNSDKKNGDLSNILEEHPENEDEPKGMIP
jgi:hypothetical protein